MTLICFTQVDQYLIYWSFFVYFHVKLPQNAVYTSITNLL